ncbi:hypothetical protein RHCRD62_60405 [Rhodococcus sp. RD6.2]|nr:hypothetical protein RHCRD62_60405 [Rhodococcus sp. RD6.2]
MDGPGLRVAAGVHRGPGAGAGLPGSGTGARRGTDDLSAGRIQLRNRRDRASAGSGLVGPLGCHGRVTLDRGSDVIARSADFVTVRTGENGDPPWAAVGDCD